MINDMIQAGHKKIAAAIGFLSLDSILSFANEIQAPWVKTSVFQAQLRTILTKHLADGSYYKSPDLFSDEVFRHVYDKYGKNVQESVKLWSGSVYSNSGHDRRPEKAWSLILAKGCAQEPLDISPNLLSQMKALNEKIQKRRSAVQHQILIEKSKPLSNWDVETLPVLYLSKEDMFESILFICTLNIFVEEWNLLPSICLEGKKELHNWGIAVGASMGMRQTDIPEPDHWCN